MANTTSIVNNGNGKFTITDSDGQTRVVNQATANAEAAKSRIKITTPGSPSFNPLSNSVTGYSNNAGGNYPTGDTSGDKTVLIAGKPTLVADAVAQAYSAANLGKIRANLIKYNQLTKAEARDPNNLLNKWAQIVYGAANDPNPKNQDPFVYAAELQKQGFGSTAAGAGGYTGPMVYPKITSAEDAKAKVIDAFKNSPLNREPTDAEIKAAIKALNADESNPKNYTTQTPIKNKAGQITGYKSTGGTDSGQFLADYINSKFASEVETAKTTAPELTAVNKDKAIYNKLIAEAGGDAAKVKAAKDTTTYGRNLAEYEASITSQIKQAGADITKASDIAKYLLDNGLKLTSDAAKAYINSQLQFGKTKVKTGATTTDMYTGAAGKGVDTLNKVALANGLTLDKVFDAATLNDILSAVNSGEDISTYTKIIRDAAKVAWNVSDNVAKLMDQGVSLDAIYGTYKNAYADTLELDPNSVTLNDLARSGIIGQQGANSQAPQNLYDFTRQLRKDDRWQYTQKAKQEVSSAAQRVLQDFGFMG